MPFAAHQNRSLMFDFSSQLAVPNTPGVEVAQHQSKVYSGQYSADGNFLCVVWSSELLRAALTPRLAPPPLPLTQQLLCLSRHASLYIRHSQRPSHWQQIGPRRPHPRSRQLNVQHTMAASHEHEDYQSCQGQPSLVPVDYHRCDPLSRQPVPLLLVSSRRLFETSCSGPGIEGMSRLDCN